MVSLVNNALSLSTGLNHHPRLIGDQDPPFFLQRIWIPASAGMTERAVNMHYSLDSYGRIKQNYPSVG